ncbi:MAG TPA: SDR family NAD(P)-dependent oxidoreductase [Rugosimonospora sp.]|nr:SDR family NAD(P)-dependent oxidoreductase [Rugosimonospora sp.]
MSFADRYGAWAVVAGASEGIGAAYATALVRRGVHVVLVARRAEPLAALADSLPGQARTVAADLSTMDGLERVYAATEDLQVGLVVCNAAYAPMGPLLDTDPADTSRAVDVNCRAPLLLAHRYLPGMAERGRGGFIIMSSLAGMQGVASLTTYAATKAYGTVLAEGLWAELRPRGVDVLACLAGAVSTPGYEAAMSRPAPGTVTPEVVAETALRSLGRGPRVVPGALMRFSAPVMSRLLPRRTAITLMGRSSQGLSR